MLKIDKSVHVRITSLTENHYFQVGDENLIGTIILLLLGLYFGIHL